MLVADVAGDVVTIRNAPGVGGAGLLVGRHRAQTLPLG
jgi:hypothetical protein